jgi:hypothetical protein
MKITQKYYNQIKYLLTAAVLMVAALNGAMPAKALAYGTLNSRSILLSSTANGANNTAYQVSFTTTTANQTVGSVVVKFCANSPIIGDGCSIPAGFDINKATLSLNSISGSITNLSVDTAKSTTNSAVLTRSSGAAAVTAGAVSFTLGNGVTNGISNPTTQNTTFYARILIFAYDSPDVTTVGAPAYESTATDAGGIAMSTATQLNVTAKVQEALTFCVYTQATCGDGGNAVALGDINGVLESTTTTYTSTAKFDVSSNAVAGVTVRLRGDTLKSGTFALDPYGATCGADSIATADERFGLRMSSLGGGMAATAPYNCISGEHGFDLTQTNTLYGQQIANTSGATDVATSTIEFAAKSANTSEAGVYTTTLTLIATATY